MHAHAVWLRRPMSVDQTRTWKKCPRQIKSDEWNENK